VNKSINYHLGQCVKELRRQKGLTQVEFSERCGFYQTYLSRIENGLSNPTLNAIEIIAISLEMSVYELFEFMCSSDSKQKKHLASQKPSKK
jgi:transcriptional regulator with XRE-family HTH domain